MSAGIPFRVGDFVTVRGVSGSEYGARVLQTMPSWERSRRGFVRVVVLCTLESVGDTRNLMVSGEEGSFLAEHAREVVGEAILERLRLLDARYRLGGKPALAERFARLPTRLRETGNL